MSFEDIGMTKVWCGHYEGNTRSQRVQKILGFRYQWKSEGVEVPLMQEKRTGHISSLTKGQWQRDRMHEAESRERKRRYNNDQ